MITQALREPPIKWSEFVWQCPFGHWVADHVSCGKCWGELYDSQGLFCCVGGEIQPMLIVHVWHNVSLRANCSEDHYLWRMLEDGSRKEPEIKRLICLHKRNGEIKSPDDGLRSEIVEPPPLP